MWPLLGLLAVYVAFFNGNRILALSEGLGSLIECGVGYKGRGGAPYGGENGAGMFEFPYNTCTTFPCHRVP